MSYENAPTPYQMRLLANKDFDFAPFWEEAVVNWLHRNTSRLLEVNPQCCQHFIGDENLRHPIAQSIPLDNDANIVMFLRTLNEGCGSEFTILYKRLAGVGKADLVVSSKLAALQYMDDPRPLITAVSDESIIRILDVFNFSKTDWDIDAFTAFIKRVPVDRLKDIRVEQIPYKTRWSRRDGHSEEIKVYNTRYKVACLLAEMLPVAELRSFISRLSDASMMSCFACGAFTAKSQPGYTLHRKCCDVKNEYPNALITAAKRLLQ